MILSRCGSFQAGPMWEEAELGTDVLAAMALNELTLYRVPLQGPHPESREAMAQTGCSSQVVV